CATGAAGAGENAREADHGGVDVGEAARIEQRRAGRAAGTPIFGKTVVGREAERAVKLLVGERTQHVLVEDRYLLPLRGIVELVQIHMVELAGVERRAPRLLDRAALAPALDRFDLGRRARQAEQHARLARRLAGGRRPASR